MSKGGGSPSINEPFFFLSFAHFFFLLHILSSSLSFAFSFSFSFSFSFAQSLVSDPLKSMETEPEKHEYNKDGLVGDSEVAFSSCLDYKEQRGKSWRCKKMEGG